MNSSIRNTLTTTAVLTGMALVASLPAQAALINTTVVGDTDAAVAQNAEQSFLSQLNAGFVTESFEGFPVETTSGPFNTAVGEFSGSGQGNQSGACIQPCSDIQVLDANASPFNGRFAVGNVDEGSKWLDSNDLNTVSWAMSGGPSGFNAFGFFLMDGADQGAVLNVTFSDQSSQDVVLEELASQANGNLYYMAGISDVPILNATVTFQNTDGNLDGDGFGIDRATLGVARVPAPGTVGLLGAGLLALGATAGLSRRHGKA